MSFNVLFLLLTRSCYKSNLCHLSEKKIAAEPFSVNPANDINTSLQVGSKIVSTLLIVLSIVEAGINADIKYESLLGIKTTVWLSWMWTKAVDLQMGIYFQPTSSCRPPFACGHF